jgi:probable phosphoglycerate mutase
MGMAREEAASLGTANRDVRLSDRRAPQERATKGISGPIWHDIRSGSAAAILAEIDPPPTMSLLIVRHGETALNAARVLQPADTPLSARGVAQAEALAERLAGHRLALILSSDLPRALRTAQAISARCGSMVQTTPLLRERNFGYLRGRPYDQLPFDPLRMRDAPPNGESGDEFEARVAQAFAEIVRRRAALADDLVVVTHGLVIGAMLARHVELAGELPGHLGNTSLSVIGSVAPYRADLVNCTAHLRDQVGDDSRALSGG